MTTGVGMYDTGGPPYSDIESYSVIANNGLIISGRDGMRLECVSNSTRTGIGTITTPEGDEISIGKDTAELRVGGATPGVLSLETKRPTSLTSSNQGIYTCTISDSNGRDISLNVGLYPHGFNG